jgi:hypothetical protein
MRIPRPKKPKIKTTYYEAPEVRDIAEDLIPEFHGTLRDATFEYCFQTREDETSVIQPPRSIDAQKFGRVQAMGAPDQKMRHLHFRMFINGNWWEHASAEQREASVDALLCRCWLKEGKPVIMPYEFKGMVAEVKRRGAWSKELADFEAARSQQELPFADDEKSVAKKKAAPKAKNAADEAKTGPTGLV